MSGNDNKQNGKFAQQLKAVTELESADPSTAVLSPANAEHSPKRGKLRLFPRLVPPFPSAHDESSVYLKTVLTFSQTILNIHPGAILCLHRKGIKACCTNDVEN